MSIWEGEQLENSGDIYNEGWQFNLIKRERLDS